MNEKIGWQLCTDGPEAYEKYIVPGFSGTWAKDIVGRANLHSGDSLLDVASPFANDILELKESTREEMFRKIHTSILDYVDDHGLAAPMECYVVSAKK